MSLNFFWQTVLLWQPQGDSNINVYKRYDLVISSGKVTDVKMKRVSCNCSHNAGNINSEYNTICRLLQLLLISIITFNALLCLLKLNNHRDLLLMLMFRIKRVV